LFVTERGAIQDLAQFRPAGEEMVHQFQEAAAMIRFKEMDHLMDYDILQALQRLFRQFAVFPGVLLADIPRLGIAGGNDGAFSLKNRILKEAEAFAGLVDSSFQSRKYFSGVVMVP
jgi:hypothetical protein